MRTRGAGGSAAVSRERWRGWGRWSLSAPRSRPCWGRGPGALSPVGRGAAPPPRTHELSRWLLLAGMGRLPVHGVRLWIGTMRGWGARGGAPRVPGAQVQAGCPLRLRLHFPGCPCGAAHVRQLPPPPRHRITPARPEPPGLSLGGRQLHKTLAVIPPAVPPLDGAEPRSRLTSGLGVVARACVAAVPCCWLRFWGLCRGSRILLAVQDAGRDPPLAWLDGQAPLNGTWRGSVQSTGRVRRGCAEVSSPAGRLKVGQRACPEGLCGGVEPRWPAHGGALGCGRHARPLRGVAAAVPPTAGGWRGAARSIHCLLW